MLTVQLKLPKKLSGVWSGAELQTLQAMAQMGGDALHARVERGVGWNGAQLPKLREAARRRSGKGRYYFVHKSDPRIGAIGTGRMRPWSMKGQKGRPDWWVFRGAYAEFKRTLGKRDTKGGSFTGRMWQSLTATAKLAPKSSGGASEIRLYFAGSSPSSYVTPGGKGGTTRLRNRDKARLLQYEGRSGVGQHNGAGGRVFELMRFAPRELDDLASLYASRVRMF